ncbi:hypothetical protein FACS1894190_14780 [Spirochaetia bacterium]|nr:hypothetical protein FACS1894190_14780 [Spirochaetia bacterium]
MVKKIFRCILCVFLLSGCEVDILGIFGSNDLDERLKHSKDFKFVQEELKKAQNFGNDYEFLVISDTHIIGQNANGLEGLEGKINGAKFIVVTGDITQSCTEEEMKRFIEIASSFSVPVFPVIGNHDIYMGHWPVWRDNIGSTKYRIDSSNTTLIILDSANAFFGNDQLSWLDEQLDTAKKFTFVFTHTNPFVTAAPEFQQQQLTDTRERARFISILTKNCQALFSGHVHKRVINRVAGIEFVTLENFNGHKTFCRVHVTPQGFSYSFDSL